MGEKGRESYCHVALCLCLDHLQKSKSFRIGSYANRYSISEDSHNSWDRSYLHNDSKIFQKFIQEVNSQAAYNNKTGFTNAIPIVAYHSIDDSKGPSSTNIGLFALEMKYLHDNGFKVIPMSDLSYDENTNYMYIRTK